MISIVLFSENYKIEIFELLNCLTLLDAYIYPYYLELANLYRNKGNLNKEKDVHFKALKKTPPHRHRKKDIKQESNSHSIPLIDSIVLI